MLDVPAFAGFFLVWLVFHGLHYALVTSVCKVSRQYKSFLKEYQLTVSLFQLRWYTTYFNRLLVRLGRMVPNLMAMWFTAGVLFGGIAMVTSVVVLVYMLRSVFVQQEKDSAVLVPVMPGMNLPWNQLGYYLVALALCGIIHELGHALAAVRENVRINGCGMFFLFVYPGAFVELSSDHLNVISPWRQLRIVCAGVWHNFVLAAGSLLLWWLIPSLLPLMYERDVGAVITSVGVNSPLHGVLSPGETVTAINNCKVSSTKTWLSCLSDAQTNPAEGYCSSFISISRKNMSLPYLTPNGDGDMDCCHLASKTHFCFSYSTLASREGYACLPARTATTSKSACSDPNDCGVKMDSTCITPLNGNLTRFMRMKREGTQDIILIASPMAVAYTASISDYRPRYRFSFLWLPQLVERLLMYIISFSGALAILNVVPCYSLDGQWALNAFVDFFLSKYIVNVKKRNLLCNCILICGTLLLMANIGIALLSLRDS